MKNCSLVAITKQSYFANFRICNEVVKAIILPSECAQDFSLGSKLGRTVLTLTCTVSFIQLIWKIIFVRREGDICQFMIKGVRKIWRATSKYYIVFELTKN